VTGQHRRGVGCVDEPGACEVLPHPGVGHRQVDLGVTVVEGEGLDRRCAMGPGELNRDQSTGDRAVLRTAFARDLTCFYMGSWMAWPSGAPTASAGGTGATAGRRAIELPGGLAEMAKASRPG
jgi:hypothetical protein